MKSKKALAATFIAACSLAFAAQAQPSQGLSERANITGGSGLSGAGGGGFGSGLGLRGNFGGDYGATENRYDDSFAELRKRRQRQGSVDAMSD